MSDEKETKVLDLGTSRFEEARLRLMPHAKLIRDLVLSAGPVLGELDVILVIMPKDSAIGDPVAVSAVPSRPPQEVERLLAMASANLTECLAILATKSDPTKAS